MTETAASEQRWGIDGQAPDFSLVEAVTIEDVRAAAARIAGHVVRTPVVSHPVLDALTGGRVLLKCENLQTIGAFKLRGGFSALTAMDAGARARGVIAYSSGNHAQAVAMAAATLGAKAVIVMPRNAPRVKLDRTRSLLADAPEGSRVIEFDPREEEREALGRQLAAEEGLTLVPPYDDPAVIAGQGTAALELFEEAGELDALYACVGGGGLLSGCATVARALSPGCRVVGSEPALADDAARSFRDGVLRTTSNPPTIADGARTPYVGRYTLPMILRRVDGIVTVGEAAIASAVALCVERLRLVVEPAGALALAAVLAAGDLEGRRVGVTISGGNIDVDRLGEVLAMADRRW